MAEFMKLEEKLIFALRELYQSYGYQQYKMSKFEPYDFYVQNKEFLVSQRVITFNDTDGVLMALKPDVTLSIVKNYRPGQFPVQKVCYSESIFRIAGAGKTYREIMQTGLECLGEIDLYALSEVLLLTLKSLEKISDHYILNLSHLGVIDNILKQAELNETQTTMVLACMEQKNESGLAKIQGLTPELVEQLRTLLHLCGPMTEVLERLPEFVDPVITKELNSLCALLQDIRYAGHVNLDFSIVSNQEYYNGLVFKGYVEGVPYEVLAGGQYDRLMKKMGKQAGGVGFAVYLDQLELLDRRTYDCGADIFLLCKKDEDLAAIHRAKEHFRNQRVLVLHQLPEKLPGGKVFQLKNGRVTEIEENG